MAQTRKVFEISEDNYEMLQQIQRASTIEPSFVVDFILSDFLGEMPEKKWDSIREQWAKKLKSQTVTLKNIFHPNTTNTKNNGSNTDTASATQTPTTKDAKQVQEKSQ